MENEGVVAAEVKEISGICCDFPKLVRKTNLQVPMNVPCGRNLKYNVLLCDI